MSTPLVLPMPPIAASTPYDLDLDMVEEMKSGIEDESCVAAAAAAAAAAAVAASSQFVSAVRCASDDDDQTNTAASAPDTKPDLADTVSLAEYGGDVQMAGVVEDAAVAEDEEEMKSGAGVVVDGGPAEPVESSPYVEPSPCPSPDTDTDSLTRAPTRTDASEGHFPFGSLSSRPYYGRDAETVQVKWIYRAVNFLTDLFFGVDKDLDHLPEKRRSVAPSTKTGTELLLPTVSVLPPAISAGYGELSWQGFDKVVYWMACEAPDFVRMGPSSIFLDIGSGFGKCVFHAKLRAQVARSVGIECIKTRHEKASEALHLLRAGFVPGLSDTKDAPKFETRDLDRQLVGCELFEGDVSLPKFHPLVHASTHIYAFDVVFSRETHAQILPIVEASDFHLFGCYLNPAKLASFGCTRFALLHTIKVHTTGKQSFTCYFYMKKEPVSPNGLHTIAPVRQTRRSTTTTTTAVAGLDPATDEFWNKMHEEAATPEPYLTEALAAVANPTPEAIAAAAASAQAALKDGLSQTLTTLCPVRGSRAKKPAAVTASPAASPVKAAKPDDTAAVTAPPATSKTNKAAKTTSSSSKKKPTTASKTTGKSTTPTKSSSKKSKSTSSSSSKKKKVEVVVSAKSKKTEAPKSKSSKKRKSVAPEEEEEEEEQEEEVTPPPAPFVKVKQLTRSELFNLSTAAALAPKPKVPRRTNNSLVVKCEPVAYVPKQLSHYLADPTREAEPILVEPTSSNTNDNTVTTAATTAAAEPSPAKKQRV